MYVWDGLVYSCGKACIHVQTRYDFLCFKTYSFMVMSNHLNYILNAVCSFYGCNAIEKGRCNCLLKMKL